MTIFAKLKKVSDLIEINDLAKARAMLKKMPAKAQKHIAFKQSYGRLLHKEGKSSKAIPLLEEVVQKNDANFDAFNTLGLAYLSEKNLDKAKESFTKCIELKPNYAYALSNLGIIEFDQGHYEQAINYCERALAHDSELHHAKNCIGISYHKMGQFDKAQDILKQAITDFDYNPEGYIYLLGVLFAKQNLSETNDFVEQALRVPYLNNIDRLEFLTVYLINSWLLSHFDRSIDILAEMSQIIRIEDEKNSSLLINNKGFMNSIKHANEFRRDYPDLYMNEECSNQIYFICESHCLAANNLKIRFNDIDYKIQSRFMRGTKMFHLSQESLNEHIQSLRVLGSQIPESQSVICGFGEIDCRLTEGFLVAHEKKGICIEDTINSVVSKYVELVDETFKDHKQIFIYGVPAPSEKVFSLDESHERKQTFIDMIKSVNEKLKQCAESKGFVFLDVYQETVNDQGTSNSEYHYDWYHVTPSIIQKLFDAVK